MCDGASSTPPSAPWRSAPRRRRRPSPWCTIAATRRSSTAARSFCLPPRTSQRENDVLTQGLISKSLVDSLARVGDSTGVVLLDGFQPPGAPATGLARLGEQIQPGSFAVIGANNDAAAQGPTAAAQALRGQMTGEEVSLEKFVGGMRGELAKSGAGTAFFVAATGRPSFLVGGKPPPAPVAAAPPPPAAPAPPAASPGAGRQCAAGRARAGSAAATGDGGRGSHVRSGPAAGPGGAGHAGILFRPHRRHLWARNSRCHPSLSVRDQSRNDGPSYAPNKRQSSSTACAEHQDWHQDAKHQDKG